MIEAVLFDWGGTLTPWNDLAPADGWRAYAAAVHAEDDARASALAASLLAADLARWAGVRERSAAFTMAQVLADAAGSTERPVGSPPAGTGPSAPPAATSGPAEAGSHDIAVAAYRTFWEAGTVVRPEVVPVLRALRERGLRLGVLSSTPWPAAWHEEWLARDGVLDLLDACVWSSDLEWTKPHPSAFRAAMDAVGASDPAACVYVGDRPYDDVSGAKGAGMRAVLVPHSDIPPEQQVPVDVHPDAVLHRFADLPDVLAGW